MTPPSGRRARPPRTLRFALLLAVAAAAGLLVFLIATDPRRIGVFPGSPGRTVSPGETGWTRLTPAPVALTEVAAAAHDGRIWVVGGLDAAGVASPRVVVYDPGTDTWSEGPRLLAGVHHAALVSDGTTLFLLGGYLGDSFAAPTDEVWRLDAGAQSWVRDAPLPEPRGAGAAAWDGRDAILLGGGVGPAGVSDVVFASDAAAGWVELARLEAAREHLAATSMGGGSVTFIGGRRGDVGNLGTIEVVSSDGGTVGRREDVPTPRGGVAAFSWPGLGDCLVGGEGPIGTFGDVECVGSTQTTALPGLGVPRHGLGAVVLGGRAYVVLGGPVPGLTVSDVIEALELPASVSR